MKKLNNEMLNNIIESFIKRKNYKEKKAPKWKSFLNKAPVPSFVIFLSLIPNIFFNHKVRSKSKYGFMKMFFLLLCHSGLFFLVSLFISAVLLCLSDGLFHMEYMNNSTILFNFSIAIFFIIDILTTMHDYKEEKLEWIFKEEKLHEEEFLSEKLNKEDLILLINSFDKKILREVIRENKNKSSLCYGDLRKLDDLLEDEKLSLKNINKKDFDEVFRKINRKALINKLNGKTQEEMIEYFENMGMKIKGRKTIIKREQQNFRSKVIPVKKNYDLSILEKENKTSKEEELFLK